MQFNALHLILYFSLIYMQCINKYIIFIYMQFNVHNLIMIYNIFMYMQFNALLIHCLLFFIPFNVYMYISKIRSEK